MTRAGGLGKVWLVGAGPGDPDLITLRGAELLRRAQAVIHDSLVASELLNLAPPDAERIDVGKRGHDPPTRSQEEINALLVRLAREGKNVVRLKGGDPFLFGRGGEEASACRAAGVPCEVVPGITSGLAGPAVAGIPVTDRRHSASVAIVTGHRDATRPWTSIRWDRLATATDTLVVLMAMRNIEKIVSTLLAHGRAPDTPAAVVMNAATREQRVLEAPLAELPRRIEQHRLGAPSVVIVGDVVRLRRELDPSTTRPLQGWRVLVTRPREQAKALSEALGEAGAEPIAVPLIEVVPLTESRLLQEAVDGLDRYDAILFTSANAVSPFVTVLRERGIPPAAVRPRLVCVGTATAEAVRRAALPEPSLPARAADAATLVDALARDGPLDGRRFLFPSAEQARDVLPHGLRAAGATVDVVAVYRTRPTHVDAAALRDALVRGRFDALTFTSPSAVRAFVACLDAPARDAVAERVVAAIGSVTAEALRADGIEPAVVAERPGARALVAALAEHAGRRRGEEGP